MRVGYCAMRASDYRKCLDAAREYERDSFFESPDVGFKPWFLETKLAAITWQSVRRPFASWERLRLLPTGPSRRSFASPVERSPRPCPRQSMSFSR